MAADYCAPIFGTRIFALGTMSTHRFVAGNKDAGLSDCVEVLDCTADQLRTVWPDLELRHMLTSNTDAFVEVISKRPDLLRIVTSCLTPIRFRALHGKRIAAKYKVALMPGRCGLCHKCAVEWLHLLAGGEVKENPAFEKHCLDVLHRKYEQFYTGRKVSRAEGIGYFFDPSAWQAVERFLTE